MRTAIWLYRSTRGVNTRPVSNGSSGSGINSGCSTSKYSSIVRGRDPIRRWPSCWSHCSTSSFSSDNEATSGTEVKWLRRK